MTMSGKMEQYCKKEKISTRDFRAGSISFLFFSYCSFIMIYFVFLESRVEQASSPSSPPAVVAYSATGFFFTVQHPAGAGCKTTHRRDCETI